MNTERIKNTIKRYAVPMTVKTAFACIVHGLMISGFLLNIFEGMWLGTYYEGGLWELTIGRWAIRYLFQFNRYISVHPFSSVLTLIIFAAGTSLMTGLFKIRPGSPWDYLISFIFLGNVVITNSISYLYMSTVFALSFVLSVLCIFFVIKSASQETKKHSIKYIAIAAICLVMQMGLYQGYLGTALLVAVFYLIYCFIMDKKAAFIRRYILGGVCAGVSGFIVYEIILHEELLRHSAAMAEYNGASNLSLGNIIGNFGGSIKRCYNTVWNYFIGNIKWCSFSLKYMAAILVGLCLIIMLLLLLSYGKIWKFIAVVLCIAVVPILANFTMILAPEAGFMTQQTGPCALIFPLLICVLSIMLSDKEKLEKIGSEKSVSIIRVITFILATDVLWATVCFTQIDQDALRQGTQAVKTLCEGITARLYSEKMLDPEKSYVFVGSPDENQIVYLDKNYEMANAYARIATVSSDPYMSNMDWKGYFHTLIGVDLNVEGMGILSEVMDDQRVKDMPCFPDEGCMLEYNDSTIVIKIS